MESIEQLGEPIRQLKVEVKQLAESNERASRLMMIPNIGPMTGLDTVLSLGMVKRFPSANQVVSYVGLDSVESSFDNLHRNRRYGHISKQGDRQLRWLLIQCASSAVQSHPQLTHFYHRLKYRKPWPKVKTAAARKLLVGCYVLLRDGIDYGDL